MKHIAYPYSFGINGQTAEATNDEYIRALMEQILFTNPGERVNRPDFGSGLMQLVFAPNSEALVSTIQMTVQAALQKWMGALIVVHGVQVEHQNAMLHVTVKYMPSLQKEMRVAKFERSV
ncbi:MAG: GPW/gp25 family protein [Alphaproteobacteria bacterium]